VTGAKNRRRGRAPDFFGKACIMSASIALLWKGSPMKRFLYTALISLPLLLNPAPAMADDVTDQIGEAQKAYEKKDLSTTLMALDAAAALVRQARADALAKLLPGPLQGWTEKESQSSSAGASMFGGGINAQKRYVKGKEKVEVTLTTDSPLLQTMSMMFANPQMSGPGARLVVINGQKVIHNKKKNSYQAMLANKVLLGVEGSRNTPEESVKAYLKAIDFSAIEKFAQ